MHQCHAIEYDYSGTYSLVLFPCLAMLHLSQKDGEFSPCHTLIRVIRPMQIDIVELGRCTSSEGRLLDKTMNLSSSLRSSLILISVSPILTSIVAFALLNVPSFFLFNRYHTG